MRESALSKQDMLSHCHQLGLRTFPLPAGQKSPPPVAFYDSASPVSHIDMCRINAGVATGKGIIVLDFDIDVDQKVDGLKTLAAWDVLGLPQSMRVSTPRGGLHVYLSTDQEIANSVKSIGHGVDVRGHHGYVVAPGSSTDVGAYTLLDAPDELAPAPDWILEKLSAPRERNKDQTPLTELDQQDNIDLAREWLVNSAPTATQGDGGDHATYGVAAQLRDFGVSEITALELLLNNWNGEKANPPWDSFELENKIANAYQYAENAPGSKTPTADFSEALTAKEIAHIEATKKLYDKRPEYQDQPDETPKAPISPLLKPLQPYDLATDVKAREYVLGKFLAKRYVTTLISPPGVGKTTFGLTAALSIATGKSLLGPKFKPDAKPQHVLYWTQEDDLDEIRMRLSAAMRFHDIEFSDTVDPLTGESRLFAISGVERPLSVAVFAEDRRSLLPSKDAAEVLKTMIDHKIAAAIFDPFLEFHPANENDNNEIGQIARIFRKMATKADAAVGIVHHTRKHNAASAETAAGDMDSGRGAGALQGVARISATLYNLDEKTAKLYGIKDEDRNRFVRLDDAKSNLSLIGHEPVLFERESVYLHELDDTIGMLRWADMQKVKTQKEDKQQKIADVLYALESLGRSVSTRPAEVAAVLADDGYEGGPADPGRYTMSEQRSLARYIKRLFDEETGEPKHDALAGYVLEVRNQRDAFIMKEGA